MFFRLEMILGIIDVERAGSIGYYVHQSHDFIRLPVILMSAGNLILNDSRTTLKYAVCLMNSEFALVCSKMFGKCFPLE